MSKMYPVEKLRGYFKRLPYMGYSFVNELQCVIRRRIIHRFRALKEISRTESIKATGQTDLS